VAHPKSQLTSFLHIVTATICLSLTGCAGAPPESRIDNVPMYGQPEIPRPDFLKKADEDFVALATSRVGNREKASVVWAVEADRYMAEGNLDFAMRRYNQSWLLNPRSFRPYWGFGRVMLQRGRIDESLKHFEKAKELIDDDYQKPALLTDAGAAYVSKASSLPDSAVEERRRFFALGDQHFSQSFALDPSYGFVYRQWAQSLYRQGDYLGAWDKVKQARRRNSPPFPPGFLRALEQRMPEPKGEEGGG
jgi:tetratricopeptide (TPR) repeat protein